MKRAVLSVVIFAMLVSTAFADDIIGNHSVINGRGLVKVRSLEGQKMKFDAIYASPKKKLIVLEGVYADYNPRTNRAIYTVDRFCPDALGMKFQDNRQVILREADCAEF